MLNTMKQKLTALKKLKIKNEEVSYNNVSLTKTILILVSVTALGQIKLSLYRNGVGYVTAPGSGMQG